MQSPQDSAHNCSLALLLNFQCFPPVKTHCKALVRPMGNNTAILQNSFLLHCSILSPPHKGFFHKHVVHARMKLIFISVPLCADILGECLRHTGRPAADMSRYPYFRLGLAAFLQPVASPGLAATVKPIHTANRVRCFPHPSIERAQHRGAPYPR